jgi:hypothetical protein
MSTGTAIFQLDDAPPNQDTEWVHLALGSVFEYQYDRGNVEILTLENIPLFSNIDRLFIILLA